MNVLVTGGSGFLGSRLVERLRAASHDPFVPRRGDYDLTHEGDAARLFADAEPELVFHLAAEVGGIGANRANPGATGSRTSRWASTCSSRAGSRACASS